MVVHEQLNIKAPATVTPPLIYDSACGPLGFRRYYTCVYDVVVRKLNVNPLCMFQERQVYQAQPTVHVRCLPPLVRSFAHGTVATSFSEHGALLYRVLHEEIEL